MFKLIILVLGLAIGFGGGLWYGVHHPTEAANLSAAEEQQVLQQTQAIKDKINQLVAKQHHGIAGTGHRRQHRRSQQQLRHSGD